MAGGGEDDPENSQWIQRAVDDSREQSMAGAPRRVTARYVRTYIAFYAYTETEKNVLCCVRYGTKTEMNV